MTQQVIPEPPSNLPYRTPETQAWYDKYWKEFWLDMELTFSQKEDTQTPFLIDTLNRELDFNKISTVLEVGIGYGRVAKEILEIPDNVIDLYDGVDISELAIKQSEIYLDDHVTKTKKGKRKNDHTGYDFMVGDFEELGICESYDLVISAETMSILPSNYNVQKWIDLMVRMSKKYVVNLDYHEWSNSTVVFNNGRDYLKLYQDNDSIFRADDFKIPDYPNEKIYICRVK